MKPFKELGKLFKKIGVPLLGAAVGGPGAGAVIDIVASALGLDPGQPEQDYIDRVDQNPEAMIKIKQIELTHKIDLEKIALQNAQMYITDVQNARSREVGVVVATKKKDFFLYGLASLIVLGYFALGVILFTVSLPESNANGANIYIGACIGAFTGVVGYFFGSSAGSSVKTALLANGGSK